MRCFFSSRRRHTRFDCDWSSDVCSSDLTTDPADDRTEELCRLNDIPCYRGHPTDLLDRHCQCGKTFGADVVLKIPSDCPLIDPSVIDRVIEAYFASNADYVSNLHPASYPDGQDVEVVGFESLERAW